MTLPHTTLKQQEIILYLYRFRFLNSTQIQTLLRNKDKRNINMWLKDLVANNYIGRKYESTLAENAKPARYFLSVNGIRYLKTQKKDKLTKLRREKYRSNKFIDECLFIANCYLQSASQTVFDFYTRNDYATDSLIGQLKPHFVRVKHEGKKQIYYAYELFQEDTPRFFMRSKILHYLEFFKNDSWSETKSLSKIFFICPDEKTEQYILRFAKKSQEESDCDLAIFTSTRDLVERQSILDSIWNQVE